MRRTITILSRFIISTTNWLGNLRIYSWALGLLILLSCDDELGDVGFKNPNRDFQVVAKEFIIPTKVFQMDSVSTSYGYVDNSREVLTPGPNRFMVGSAEDPVFGKTTAVAYSPYWAASFPLIDPSAEFESLELTLMFDYYYWTGDRSGSDQLFQVYELTDSMLTYRKHYSNQTTPYGKLLGEATHVVVPADFDENILSNSDDNTDNDIADSVNITLDPNLGRELLAAAIDTVGDNEDNYNYFYKFRRIFKGLAFVSPNSNKIVGFDPSHAKTRIVLKYKQGDDELQLRFNLTPSGQAVGTAEYMAYTELKNDRSGTALAGLPQKYIGFEPPDGMRYVQCGTGIATRLDFSEVYEYFKDIPAKALSVAELKIETQEQPTAPLRLRMRVIKDNNREWNTSTQYIDAANDAYRDVDGTFVTKHVFETNNILKPNFKADVLGDDGGLFVLSNVTEPGTGSSTYVGYLTNYMQQEVSLGEADFLRYYELIPQSPDISRGVNGFYFPSDKIKLTIYYTTPQVKQ